MTSTLNYFLRLAFPPIAVPFAHLVAVGAERTSSCLKRHVIGFFQDDIEVIGAFPAGTPSLSGPSAHPPAVGAADAAAAAARQEEAGAFAKRLQDVSEYDKSVP